MSDENPFHPIDPFWFAYKVKVRKERERKNNKKISNIFKEFRAKNQIIIMTTPNPPFNISLFMKKGKRAR